MSADTVVLAVGMRADLSVADHLEAEGFSPVVIGDATGVSYIEGAVRDGFNVGYTLGDPDAEPVTVDPL